METIINYLVLIFFAAIALLCLYQLRKKKAYEYLGEENRPFVPKGLHKYENTDGFRPELKDIGFPPKEFGETKGTKHHKQRKSWKT